MLRTFALLAALCLVGCERGPKQPTAAEARAAYDARAALVATLEEALHREIDEARLYALWSMCADEPCRAAERKRDAATAAAQARMQKLLDATDAVCAEITVIPGGFAIATLRASIATCPPGRRGDSIDPMFGFVVAERRVGRGVYFETSDPRTFHPGIAIEHDFKHGYAEVHVELYFYADGTIPRR